MLKDSSVFYASRVPFSDRCDVSESAGRLKLSDTKVGKSVHAARWKRGALNLEICSGVQTARRIGQIKGQPSLVPARACANLCALRPDRNKRRSTEIFHSDVILAIPGETVACPALRCWQGRGIDRGLKNAFTLRTVRLKLCPRQSTMSHAWLIVQKVNRRAPRFAIAGTHTSEV